jgi:predicted DNA-binding transcriptional regulator AlpA
MSAQIQTTSENQKGPKFLNVKELSEMLRLKTRTIYDMVSQDEYRIGRREITSER